MNQHLTSITISNIIATGAAFAIKHGTGESCYIPATVMFASGAKPGSVVNAELISNPNEFVRERTPYMVRYIEATVPEQLDLPLETPAQAVQPVDTSETVRQRIYKYVERQLRAGGVWTVSEMFSAYAEDFNASGGVNSYEYIAVRDAIRSVFDKGNCAKWSLYTSSSNTKSTKDWYSCYPNSVDVAEFVE
jgi:hypothetical protein